MNFKSIQLFIFVIFTTLFVSFASQPASHAADLVPTISVTDGYVAAKQTFHCGTAEDTSIACQDELSNCETGIGKIMDNAHSACGKSPDDPCMIEDVETTFFTPTAYNLLVSGPIHRYANSIEVSLLKNCRDQNPKSADAVAQPAAAEMIPAPVVANAAPEVMANNAEIAAPVASAEKDSAGGCSLNISNSPSTHWQIVLAVLAMLIPLAAIKLRQGMNA